MSENDAKQAKRHRCPPWCHRCPDLIAIVNDRCKRNGETIEPDEYVMPGCMGGAHWGIGGCCCETAPTARKTYRVTVELSQSAFDRLSDLIGAPYSSDRYSARASLLLGQTLRRKPLAVAESESA